MTVEQKIINIINSKIDIKMQMSFPNISPEVRLADIGVDSITFVRIIVAIEAEFCFEFDDYDLDHTQFPNFASLVTYVRNKMNS